MVFHVFLISSLLFQTLRYNIVFLLLLQIFQYFIVCRKIMFPHCAWRVRVCCALECLVKLIFIFNWFYYTLRNPFIALLLMFIEIFEADREVFVFDFSSVYRAIMGHTKQFTLQWHHNECDGVSNHQRLDCLLSLFFERRSKKTPKLRVTGLCEGNSPVSSEFPAQRASSAENVFIWWRHQEVCPISLWDV